MAISEAVSSAEVQAAWAKLTEEVRTGVLLTLRNGRPFGRMYPMFLANIGRVPIFM